MLTEFNAFQKHSADSKLSTNRYLMSVAAVFQKLSLVFTTDASMSARISASTRFLISLWKPTQRRHKHMHKRNHMYRNCFLFLVLVLIVAFALYKWKRNVYGSTTAGSRIGRFTEMSCNQWTTKHGPWLILAPSVCFHLPTKYLVLAHILALVHPLLVETRL